MIAGALHDYRQIWRVTTGTRSPALFKVLGIGLGVPLLVLGALNWMGVLGAVRITSTGALRALLGVASLALLASWALVHMPGSWLVHGRASGFLTPRQRGRLVQMAVGGWVLGSAGFALAFGEGYFFPVTALWALCFGLGRGWPALAGATFPFVLNAIQTRLPAPVVDALKHAPATLVESLLVLALGCWVLSRQYPTMGERRRRTQGIEFTLGAVEGNRAHHQGQHQAQNGAAALALAITRPYLQALRSACRRRDPDAMLVVALGPAAHWNFAMIGMSLFAALAVLVLMLPGGGAAGAGGREMLLTVGLWLVAGILCACTTAIIRQQIVRLRGEQALLRLTPLLGDAALLNRRVARASLKLGLRHLCFTAAGVALLAWPVGGLDAVVKALALCCLGGQFALALVLRDYARAPSLSWRERVGLPLLGGFEFLVTVGLGWAAGFSGWPWLALASVVGGVVQVTYRWRRVMKAAPAFPAGRNE